MRHPFPALTAPRVVQLLVELPHKDSDCVDLSGDTGAVGRFTFCDRVRSQTRGGPSAAASDPEAEEAPPSPGGDAGAAGAPPAAGDGRGDQNGAAATEEGLVLDLKGVKFDARIAALAGTACVVNIGPSGAKVCPARSCPFNDAVPRHDAPPEPGLTGT